MPLIQDIRGLFARRRPTVVDLSSTQAAGLTAEQEWAEEVTEPASPVERIEEFAAPQEKRNGRARTSIELPAGLDDAVEMVRSISLHLERQHARTDRLFEHIERLPQALDALPEINRQSSRLLEVVNEHLQHTARRDQALNETLAGISEASSRHTEVLGLIQQQLDANNRTSDSLLENLAGFRESISALAASNGRTSSVLDDLTRSNESRDQQLTSMLGRANKWMTVAMICCAAASATAVAVAAISLFGIG